LFRYDVYQRSYAGAPGTEAYLEDVRRRLADNPRWFDDELARIRAVIEGGVRSVYGSRDQRFVVDAMPALLAESDEEGQRAESPLRGSDGFATSAASSVTVAPAGGRPIPSGDRD
jgi:hypothetical protein